MIPAQGTETRADRRSRCTSLGALMRIRASAAAEYSTNQRARWSGKPETVNHRVTSFRRRTAAEPAGHSESQPFQVLAILVCERSSRPQNPYGNDVPLGISEFPSEQALEGRRSEPRLKSRFLIRGGETRKQVWFHTMVNDTTTAQAGLQSRPALTTQDDE